MYIIIGADRREYGPVTLDQLRQWIAEGRVNGQTRVRVEGSTDWKPLLEISELSVLLPSQPAPPSTFAPAPFSVTTSPRTNQMATAGMVLGILSLTLGCCCYGLPFNIAGVICSLVALSQISKDPITQQGKAFAITGLVLSLLSLLMSGLLMIFSFSGTDLLRKINRL